MGDASDPAVYRDTNGVPRLNTGEVTHLNVKEGQGMLFMHTVMESIVSLDIPTTTTSGQSDLVGGLRRSSREIGNAMVT